MSQTFSIACTACQVHLGIAQGWPDTSPERCRVWNNDQYGPLRDFLFAHRGHPLIFDNNCEAPIDDMEEILKLN